MLRSISQSAYVKQYNICDSERVLQFVGFFYFYYTYFAQLLKYQTIQREKSLSNRPLDSFRIILLFSARTKETRSSQMSDSRFIEQSLVLRQKIDYADHMDVIAPFVQLMSMRFCTFNNVDLSTREILLLNTKSKAAKTLKSTRILINLSNLFFLVALRYTSCI